MKRFACLLICLAAFTTQAFAQIGNNPFGPGHRPGFHPPGGRPRFGPPVGPGFGPPVGPGGGQPEYKPRKTEDCASFWMKEGESCYLFDSGAFLRQPGGAFNPTVVNQDGLFQASANNYCARMMPGASLVTINDRRENDFLYQWMLRMMPDPQRPVWIGLTVKMINGTWQWVWFSGERVTFNNWEGGQIPQPEPLQGATLLDADPLFQRPNQVDVSNQWKAEDAMNEQTSFICEYHPKLLQAPAAPTSPSTTTFQPATRPVMLNNNPMNIMDILGGTHYGGSRLHEVPRQRNRPVNYRMNPFYGVQP